MTHYCAVAEARGRMPCGDQCDECRDHDRSVSGAHCPDCERPWSEHDLNGCRPALTDVHRAFLADLRVRPGIRTWEVTRAFIRRFELGARAAGRLLAQWSIEQWKEA